MTIEARLPAARRGEPEIMIPGILADGSLYPIEKLEAHRAGVLHLAISAFVFCDDALLIQRRALAKYHCGGQWANTCCTHPHWGEDVACAAVRRVREELGLDLSLAPARVVEYEADVGNGLTEHERVHMFTALVPDRALALAPDPAEVSETRWATAAELHREIAEAPGRFTPWFRIYLERFPDLRV